MSSHPQTDRIVAVITEKFPGESEVHVAELVAACRMFEQRFDSMARQLDAWQRRAGNLDPRSPHFVGYEATIRVLRQRECDATEHLRYWTRAYAGHGDDYAYQCMQRASHTHGEAMRHLDTTIREWNEATGRSIHDLVYHPVLSTAIKPTSTTP